jgi:ribonuclease R
VRVQVSRVDLDGRKIDFRMVRDGEGERQLQRGKGAAAERAPGEKLDSAAAELAAVKQADRLARGAAKAVQTLRGAAAAVAGRPARSRKPGPQRASPKARSRR